VGPQGPTDERAARPTSSKGDYTTASSGLNFATESRCLVVTGAESVVTHVQGVEQDSRPNSSAEFRVSISQPFCSMARQFSICICAEKRWQKNFTWRKWGCHQKAAVRNLARKRSSTANATETHYSTESPKKASTDSVSFGVAVLKTDAFCLSIIGNRRKREYGLRSSQWRPARIRD
jgi:hypothetical protein